MKASTKIKIGEKEYPCRITMGAMVRFKNESGKDVSEMKEGDITSMALFLWCSVMSASNADGVPFDMSFMDFADRMDPNSVGAFYQSLSESQKKNDSSGTEVEIEKLLGMAVGCIGMSRRDFEQCTPSEFAEVAERWHAQQQFQEQSEWERARWTGMCILQPWSKKTLKPRDIATFPWEEKTTHKKETLTPEEERARYEAAKQRYGLK